MCDPISALFQCACFGPSKISLSNLSSKFKFKKSLSLLILSSKVNFLSSNGILIYLSLILIYISVLKLEFVNDLKFKIYYELLLKVRKFHLYLLIHFFHISFFSRQEIFE